MKYDRIVNSKIESKAILVTGRGGSIGLRDVEDLILSRQSAHRWR
jgi:FlaA1/EpsC-like NDP-sugar epimerase